MSFSIAYANTNYFDDQITEILLTIGSEWKQNSYQYQYMCQSSVNICIYYDYAFIQGEKSFESSESHSIADGHCPNPPSQDDHKYTDQRQG